MTLAHSLVTVRLPGYLAVQTVATIGLPIGDAVVSQSQTADTTGAESPPGDEPRRKWSQMRHVRASHATATRGAITRAITPSYVRAMVFVTMSLSSDGQTR